MKKLEKDQLTIQEDYETLVKIMNRARKLVLFEEDDSAAPTFKMDRNGNLEKNGRIKKSAPRLGKHFFKCPTIASH
ncbi:hypothetical protein BsIDN1_65870 [Bacillus safensis]|uniref:Uncharacterized protein n=1 Tax=Bacillus safensis TaxID=561879 RepID=A0A5S9MLX0_BACIA|nr:hypothetical protein BsIDN1_65870 [Bacillus safensis]